MNVIFLIALGLTTQFIGCSNTLNVDEANNIVTVYQAGAEVEKFIENHPEWRTKDITITSPEVFYDFSGRPQIYEFILMKRGEDVGSIVASAKTGVLSEQTVGHSISYQLDKYFNDFVQGGVRSTGLEILDKRRIYSEKQGASWGLKFKTTPSGQAHEYIFGCSAPKGNNWFEFRQGAGVAACELVLDSGAGPLPY